MKGKALRRQRAKEFTDDGLPRDATAWTAQDWQDLHEAIEAFKRRVRERHAKQGAKRCRK